MARKRLGELLVEHGLVDDIQLRSALGQQRRTGEALGRILVERGWVTEEALVSLLSAQLNMPAVNLDAIQPSPQALMLLDLDFCQRHNCVPFGYEERGRFLDVAMADPTNQALFDEIRVQTRCNVRPHLAGPLAIASATSRFYGGGGMGNVSGEIPIMVTQERVATGASVAIDFSASGQMEVQPIAVDVGLPGPAAPAPAVTSMGESIELEPAPPMPEITPVAEDPRAPAPPPAPPDAASLRSGTMPPPPPLDEVGGTSVASEMAEPIFRLAGDLAELRTLVQRDERVLRKLMALLIRKGVCSAEELNAVVLDA